MITSISWRNVWRNRLRSAVILSAVGIGMFAGVFSWALYGGMVNKRIETAISTEASNMQVHLKDYLEDPAVHKYMANSDSLVRLIEENSLVQGASKRVLVNGMIMSAEKGTGAQVMGIDTENEMMVTDIHQYLADGTYFTGMKRNPILIGKKMAEKLNLKIRSKIVLTFQHSNGSLIRDQFRVVGIYDITNSMYEDVNVFVRSSDLSKIIGLGPDASHEIAIKLNNNNDEKKAFEELSAQLSAYDVQTWRDIMPEVGIAEESMDVSMIVFIIIILVGLCLAIINTMLMAVLERVKEIGMLMAIGMNKSRVFMMILLETLFLSITGTVAGIVIASALSLYLGNNGLDLSMGTNVYESMGYSSIVYPMLQGKIIWNVTLMVLIATILSAIYPAIRALKLNPADAIRSDV